MFSLSLIEMVQLHIAEKKNREGEFWCKMELKFLRKWHRTDDFRYREFAAACNFRARVAYQKLLNELHIV